MVALKGQFMKIKQIGNTIIKIEKGIGGVLLLLMLCFVFFGTVGRYTGLYNMFWSDEASRYCMIWMVFLLAGLSAQNGQMFSIDLLSEKLSKRGQKTFVIVRTILVIAFCIFACIYGWQMITHQIRINQTSPAMKMPMWLMYASVPIGCLILIIHYVVLGFQEFTQIDGKEV